MRGLRIGLVCISLLACKERPQHQQGGPPVREIAVTEKGFEPARVNVAPAQQVVLRFVRKVAQTCADSVDVDGDPVRHMLPLDVPIDIKVTAPASGELAFACPMKMYRGAIVVVGH
jgi:plastocyanin domain-containing protein